MGLAPCRRLAAWCGRSRSEGADHGTPPERLAAEALAGPVSAVVERIVDGDTVDVRARIWLGQSLTVRVRIEGVDAPETRSRRARTSGVSRSRRAISSTRRLLNRDITLLHVVYDKFGGRVRADISDSDGDIAQALLAAGLARPYHGERREPWCAAG